MKLLATLIWLGQVGMSPAFVYTVSERTAARETTSSALFSAVVEPPSHTEGKRKKVSEKIASILKRSRKPERIHTIKEYKAVVVDETEKLVVVRFYSPVCRSCKAAEKYFFKLCRDNPDVKFVELPTTKDNSYLHEGLGIETFPFGHIYHPDAGLVEELKINKHVFGDFERTLKYYVDGQGEVDYSEQGLCEPAGCRIDYD